MSKAYSRLGELPRGRASERITPGCLVLEGGALRGTYSVGVMDALMEADINLQATVGVSAGALNGISYVSGQISQRRVKCAFTCQGKKITTVMVNGLATPKAGETPDYTATTAYPEWYQLDPIYAGTNGIVWYDEEGHQMDPSDRFEAGKKYKVEIKLISAKLDGANTSQFVAPVSAYVNGKPVVQNDDWDAVYTSTNTVHINYTFPSAAASTGTSGDVDGNGAKDVDDAIYLLQHVLMPEMFPVAKKVDFDKNGAVDVADAIYLLQHVLMPDMFPL